MMVTIATVFLVYSLYNLNSVESRSCPRSFHCGDLLGNLEFPLSNNQHKCGLFMVNCSSQPPQIKLNDQGLWYDILRKESENKFVVQDPFISQRNIIKRNACLAAVLILSPTNTPAASFTISPNLTLFKCINISDDESERLHHFNRYKKEDCYGFNVYYSTTDQTNGFSESDIPSKCTRLHLPLMYSHNDSTFEPLASGFTVEWNVSERCYQCHRRGGQCVTNNMNHFLCKKGISTLMIALIISGGVIILICMVTGLIMWFRRKRIKAYFISRNRSFGTSSNSDIEGEDYGIPIFCYNELEKLTNNFDLSKELGDGGFGTVYYGKLKDGREVAIKRLYEHNFKRVQQFMNEIHILTTLKHPNLVTLYGCTSKKSRELILVYEYIANGTVADHLHGVRAKEAPLTWALRMSIAIETASALTYLHKSDIVHRDVKTNNILLDSNYSVKVADFGLSRLFPADVSHISTAPQGTPGYVDPEYHQCYQLTDKSDVYSFGVVLVELISSMPAVDITRHRHEINLANLAVNRIQRSEFDELIDSSLGHKTDSEVMRMTTSVAELAFQCLQLEKDLRPSMDEVLDFLRDIQSGEEFKFDSREDSGHYNAHGKIPPSPETEDVKLLKNRHYQTSPVAVTDVWCSATTTASSIE